MLKPPDPCEAFARWHAVRAAGGDALQELGLLQRAVCAALSPIASRNLPSGLEPGDLIQEAWGRFQPRAERGEFEPRPGFPVSWFRRVVQNLVIDHARRQARGPSSDQVSSAPDKDPGPPEAVEREESVERVRRALESLRVENNGRAYDTVALLWAHHVEGKTAEEIARALGKKVNAVEKALERARDTLRRRFQEGQGESP